MPEPLVDKKQRGLLGGSPWWDVVAITVASLGSGLLVAVTDDGNGDLALGLLGLVQAVLFLGWGWASWRLARRRGDWERAAWLWFAACVPLALVGGAAAYALGATVEVTPGGDPATSLLTFVLYGVLFWGLLVLNLGSARSTNAWRRALDAAIIAGSLFFILWGALYRDIFEASSLPVSARIVVIATPFLDAALVTLAALALAVPDPSRPRGYGYLLAGLVVVFVGDGDRQTCMTRSALGPGGAP